MFNGKCLFFYFLGDTSGQVEPLLSSFDEPVPLTAIPANAMLNRLEEEESALIEEYDTDADTDADSHHRRQQEDEDAKIPLLTSPEVTYFPFSFVFFFYFTNNIATNLNKLKIYLAISNEVILFPFDLILYIRQHICSL